MTRGDGAGSPPEHGPRCATQRVSSLVLVLTGDGKGKTTAAMGTVLRARGHGWPVSVIQFMKSGRWRTGEEQAARQLGVDWWTIGDGFSWDSEDLPRSAGVAAEAWRAASQVIAANTHRLVVLDEITYPMTWGWIDTAEVVAVIAGRPAEVNIVCTGRDAPEALVEVADTVTEMRKVKHVYDTGVLAKKGIDY
jgi:cob(I)alamin adenosyltransferase